MKRKRADLWDGSLSDDEAERAVQYMEIMCKVHEGVSVNTPSSGDNYLICAITDLHELEACDMTMLEFVLKHGAQLVYDGLRYGRQPLYRLVLYHTIEFTETCMPYMGGLWGASIPGKFATLIDLKLQHILSTGTGYCNTNFLNLALKNGSRATMKFFDLSFSQITECPSSEIMK